MDAFKLLSRSAKFSRKTRENPSQRTPSSGRTLQPQLFGDRGEIESNRLGKRKREHGGQVTDDGVEGHLDFFNEGEGDDDIVVTEPSQQNEPNVRQSEAVQSDTQDDHIQPNAPLPLEERKRILKQHKLKVTWLNPQLLNHSSRPRKPGIPKGKPGKNGLYPDPLRSLLSLNLSHAVSKRLADNVAEQGYVAPTEVQIAAIPLLLEESKKYLAEVDARVVDGISDAARINLLTVAPTGSGKTIAFMIPLLHSLLSKRKKSTSASRYTSAIILAPTKELVSQITNEGRKLANGTGLTISQFRKGMRLQSLLHNEGGLGKDGIEMDEDKKSSTMVKADIVISTPGMMQSILSESETWAWQIQHLILDEADVLLDQLFREQTLGIWNRLSDLHLQVSMWSATMGSNVEELAVSTINHRLERLTTASGLDFKPAPLVRLIVGLKDSAVPNVEHILTYAGTERGKLLGLRQLLHPASSLSGAGTTLRPPFLVFTQTIERAIALHSELLYDIPVEAGGSDRLAVLHSDLSDTMRDNTMTRFRKGEVWVLITTDLLSRGVDFRGINGVVNYDIPTSSAAYVHRIGRTGRAGRKGGVAVTLYSKEDIPYLRPVASVVSMAQKQKGEGDGDTQQWLLDSLPKLSKNEKRNLKKRGIESRTARGQQRDPKAAKRSRISSKAGYVRSEENRRKGAIAGSQRRQAATSGASEGEESEFGGFD